MSTAAQPHTSHTKDNATPATPRPVAPALAPDLQSQGPLETAPRLSAAAADPSALTSPAQILALQRTVGNRAVQRLLAKNPQAARNPPAAKPDQTVAEPLVSSLSHPAIALRRSTASPVIQRVIGKDKGLETAIRVRDGKRFTVTDNYDDHDDPDIQYYDLVSETDNEQVLDVPHDTPDFNLPGVVAVPVPIFRGVASKYESLDAFDGPPRNADGAWKQTRLIAYIDNCILAGLPQSRVVQAASTVLIRRGGWQASDFGTVIQPEFTRQLQSDIRDVSAALIEACFTMTPDEAELLAFAAEREPEEADDAEFELEDEAEFVESTAQHFLTDGEGFKKLWRTSPPGQKQLIHSLMAVDHELQRLSGIGYLLEAIDLPRHRYGLEAIFSAWANGRSDKPFFEYLNAQPPMEERPIKYYNEAEREAYRLEPGPAMMRTTGDVLDGDNIFVMSGNNQIYAGAKSRGDVNVHHSSFLAGEAVASAGHLFANNGDLWKINLASGHYTPGRPQLARVLVVLQEWGVDLTQVQAVAGEHDAEEKINAEDWLARYLSTLAEGEGEKEAGDF